MPSSFFVRKTSVLSKLWDRSLTSSQAITQSEPQHIVPDSRSDLCWETLSKPPSEKATHGNHVYFFPLTSLHTTHTHTQPAAEKTHKWIHTCINPKLTYTYKCTHNTHSQKHNARGNTLSHTWTSETDDYSVSRPQSQNGSIIKLFGVLERSKVPLEELQQGGEIRSNTTHWVFYLSTALTWPNTGNVTYSPGLSKVLLIHDLLILLMAYSQQKSEYKHIFRVSRGRMLI